jgi:hypothetical protein
VTLVYAPKPGHNCDIDWESVPWPPDGVPPPPPGVTRRLEMVHHLDPPGTVRRCETCGRCWVAERNRPGMAGVFWRPEKRRERRRRERASA